MSSADHGISADLPALAPISTVGALRAVRSLRLMAVAETSNIDVQPRLTELLGNARAATAFRLLLATMSAAWPDPLAVFRPCCPRLTHDEVTLLTMLHHAGAHDQPAFDRHLVDMIAPDARALLYDGCLRLNAAQTVF
jgi:hypothetical protein